MVSNREFGSTANGQSSLPASEELSRELIVPKHLKADLLVNGMMLVRKLSRRLARYYGNPRLHNKENPLDELIFIILSAKTTEPSYLRTYRLLKRTFPNWFDILDSPTGSVARVIARGGLATKKESQIWRLLTEIRERTGRDDLNFLKKMTTEEAEKFLTSLPGVGFKTARCVLMYTMNRHVFPVDTHVKRVLSRIGIIRPERLTDKVQADIQSVIPEDIRYELHVNLVAHGRSVCTARNPTCNYCLLNDTCNYHALERVSRSLS